MSVQMFARILTALVLAASWSHASFAVGADKWHLRTLASFCSEQQCTPAYPNGTLSMDGNGNLFGTTANGGIHGDGSVFEVYRDPGRTRWKLQTIYNFCALSGCADGESPQGNVILATDGNVYGITMSGGAFGAGIFYRLVPNRNRKNWTITVLYSFCSKDSSCSDGGQPAGGLTYKGAAAGSSYDFSSPLYGTTGVFGRHGWGTAFALHTGADRKHWDTTILYRFCKNGTPCADGEGRGSLLVDSNGDLVGASSSGGANNYGVAFRLSPSTIGRQWTETILYNFCSQAGCTDGASPNGGLIEDAAGNLFGVTSQGGGSTSACFKGCGVVYEIAADETESTLYQFCSSKDCVDGSIPIGPLTIDALGSLYGVTAYGGEYANNPPAGGTVFKLTGTSLETLYSFCPDPMCPDGDLPITGLTMNSLGDLFGATFQGGQTNVGTVYELIPPG